MDGLITKCKAMIEELETVKAGCVLEGGRLKDIRSEAMYAAINAAQRELNRVVSVMNAYYSEV